MDIWIDKEYVQKKPVCNFSSRPISAEINSIIIHYTAAEGHLGSWRWFDTADSNVSAHFILGRQGEVIQCVALNKKAWHAGTGILLGIPHPNQYSVGIEIANFGKLLEEYGKLYTEEGGTHYLYNEKKYGPAVKAGYVLKDPYNEATEKVVVDGMWEPYTDATISTLAVLIRDIVAAVPTIDLSLIVGHEDIAVPLGRKIDPGPAFPWELLYRKMGMTYVDYNRYHLSRPLY